MPKHSVHLISHRLQHHKPPFFLLSESNFCNILTFSIWPGWKRWKGLPLKSDQEDNAMGKLYITFSLPVINYAAVHLVIQRIHIFSTQLCVPGTLPLSFPWFCQGRGDYLTEGTFAAWAGFGQQGLRANSPLLSNEQWFFFSSFSNKKGICQTTVNLALEPPYCHCFHSQKWKKVQQLRKVRTKTKYPPHLPMSTTCQGKTKTLQYFGMGFGAVSKVTVPKEL